MICCVDHQCGSNRIESKCCWPQSSVEKWQVQPKKKIFNAYLGLWLVTKDMSVFGCSNFEHDAFLTIWCFLNVTSDEDLLKLQVAGDG
jgi:hypothetical protein